MPRRIVYFMIYHSPTTPSRAIGYASLARSRKLLFPGKRHNKDLVAFIRQDRMNDTTRHGCSVWRYKCWAFHSTVVVVVSSPCVVGCRMSTSELSVQFIFTHCGCMTTVTTTTTISNEHSIKWASNFRITGYGTALSSRQHVLCNEQVVQD